MPYEEKCAPIAVLLCALALAASLTVLDAAAQRERQTVLVLPKIPPHARPVLLPQVGHSETIFSVAFSPDGRKLASGSADQTILIWDLETGQAQRTLKGQQGVNPVDSVSFSLDGKKLASGSRDGIKIWDITAGQVEKELDGSSPVSFSPDGRTLAGRLRRGVVAIWDVQSGQVVRTLSRDTDIVNSLSFSADGSRLAWGCRDETVVVWDLQTGRIENTLGRHRPEPIPSSLAPALNAVAFSRDGRKLAAAGGGRLDERRHHYVTGRITIWDVATARADKTWEGHSGRVTSVAFSADEKELNSCSGDGVIMWDVASGQARKTYKGLAGWPGSLSLSRDGKKLAVGTGKTVTILDADSLRLATTLRGHTSGVLSASFSPDGKKLASSSYDHTIAIWNAESGQAEKTLTLSRPPGAFPSAALSVSFSPDCKKLASASDDGTVVIWDVDSWHAEKTLRGHRSSVESVSFSPDGRRLASGSWDADSPVIIWDVATGRTQKILTGPTGAGGPVCFCHDGKKLASGSIRDGTVTIWDTEAGQAEMTLKGHTDGVPSVSFTPDGKRLASASGDKTVIIWDAVSGRPSKTLKLGALPRGLSFSPDGTKLATSAGETVIIWGTEAGQAEMTLTGHTSWVNSVSFSPNGQMLASSSFDGTVKLWDVCRALGERPTREVATLVAGDGGTCWLASTPEGYYDCSLGADNLVAWQLGDCIYPFDQFAEKFHRPDLVRKALAGKDISNAPPLDSTQIPPNIAFASPEYGAEVAGDKVEVAIEVAGVYPIKRVELSVNGRTVPAEVARALEVEKLAEKERTFHVTVPLPPNEPQVRLRAVAYDSELLKSRPAELFLQRAGMKEQPGKLYLLAIGVSRYQNPAWNTLQYADADAKAFAETFGKAQGGQYEKVEQRLLTDQEATVSNVKFALRGLKDTVTEGDVAVVFAAGHGIEQAGDYYFLCHDTKEADLANTALPWQDFVNVLREVRAKRLLLFVDTCHAGFVTGWRTTDNLIDRLNRKAGALVFSASRGEEASMERADWGHGAFTKGLLEGLEGKADTENDGRITLQELRDFVIPRVEELTDNRQHPYLPRLQEFEPQAVVARSIGGVS
jgi:WD40 repeat protein